MYNMGLLDKILHPRGNKVMKKMIQETREIVHDDKNQFSGVSVDSQIRISRAINRTDRLQEEFRKSAAYQISIRTGRPTQ